MNNSINPSLLSSLRSVTPLRPTTFGESLRVAELQANKLLEYGGATDEPFDDVQICDLPRVVVTYADLPVSGTSHWNGTQWVIALNRHEPLVRQRFTMLHEFKHVVDHGQAFRLYTSDRRHSAQEQAELAADYFAGCALVPKRLLKRAWGQGIQRVSELAEHFGVSTAAIDVRLAQTGLNLSRDRCARPIHSPGGVQRFRAYTPKRSFV